MKLFVATAVALAAAAPAAAQDGPSPLFNGNDLFNLSVASDPQISPDGKQIAYVRMSGDIMSDRMVPSIWLVDVATAKERPLEVGPGAPSSPRWSPDGTRLAFVSTREGDRPQLYVHWLESGASARLTGLPDAPQAMKWSPDGRRIAYTMRVPGTPTALGKAPAKPEGATWAAPLQVIDKVSYRSDGGGYVQPGYAQLFVIDAQGGAPRQLTFGDRHHGGPVDWSADGRTLYFSANIGDDWELEPLDSDIQSLDLASGRVRALTDRKGPDASPAVSPDGKRIAYLGHDDVGKGYEQSHLYVMNLDGSDRREIAPDLDRSIERIEWTADGRSIVAGFQEAGGYRIARITLGGDVSTLAAGVVSGGGLDRPYAGGGFSLADDGTIAFVTGDEHRPGDLAVARRGTTRTLTRLNELALGDKRLGSVRALDVTAPDGGDVPSWIVLPPTYVDGQRVPLILEIHGGPYAAYGPQFSTDYQLYAAAGYAVLYTNPRGSTGYGQAFADGIEKTYPASNYEDLMAAVDVAVASGIADPQNLFVTGGSGGGVLTSWLVGKTDRFRAAATQKPVINWTTQALVSDGIPFFARYWMGALPWEAPTAYWERSPLSLVGSVKTPTLVVVGSEDYRTPVAESEQYYGALKLAGVDTALVLVPGASHGGIAARPSQSAAKAAAIIAWFDKYRVR